VASSRIHSIGYLREHQPPRRSKITLDRVSEFNSRVPAREELEFDADVGFPFLDDLLHFVLLVLRPNGLDEAVGDGLVEGHIQDEELDNYRSNYLFIVPHAIGVGEDGAKLPRAGLLSTASPFIEGSIPAEVLVFVVLALQRHARRVAQRWLWTKVKGREEICAYLWLGYGRKSLRGPFISFCRI